jgi:hypothetical protein
MKTLFIVLLLLPATLASAQGQKVGLKEWSWKPIRTTDSDVISIKFTITNNTPKKLVNAKFDVYLYGQDPDTIAKSDRKVLLHITQTAFTDDGYDFVPSNELKKSDLLVSLKKYASSSVVSVSVELLSFDSVDMTPIDVSLTKVGNFIDALEAQEKDVPDASYAAQRRFLAQKEALKATKL